MLRAPYVQHTVEDCIPRLAAAKFTKQTEKLADVARRSISVEGGT